MTLAHVLHDLHPILHCYATIASHAGNRAVLDVLQLLFAIEAREQPVTAARDTFKALLCLSLPFTADAREAHLRVILPALLLRFAKMQFALQRPTKIAEHYCGIHGHASLPLASWAHEMLTLTHLGPCICVACIAARESGELHLHLFALLVCICASAARQLHVPWPAILQARRLLVGDAFPLRL